MYMNRIGKQTVWLKSRPKIIASAAVGGKEESEGPLSASFDYLSEDTYFGAESWESAESAMLRKCFDICLNKSGLTADNIDYIFGGDLLNQCVASGFAIRDVEAPYFGLYGACSTMAESLSLASILVDGGYAGHACAMTSSHFCSAERQFRLPLSYGGQRTPTAQWTATAAGSVVLADTGVGPSVTCVTTGILVDSGIGDAANLGAAMAPAALETLCTHFADTGRTPEYYDVIATGDLGTIGSNILLELAQQKGYNLKGIHIDCGNLLFNGSTQDVHAGGSGCGCSASVLCGELIPKLCRGEIKKLLFAATGAIMSTTTALQGESILGICHAVAIEMEAG